MISIIIINRNNTEILFKNNRLGNLKRLALLRLNKDIEQLNLSNTQSGTVILEKKKSRPNFCRCAYV